MTDELDSPWQIGEFVRVGDSLGVAVPLPADWEPDYAGVLDHVGVWYGERDAGGRPRVRTVPVIYVERAAPLQPRYRPA